MIERLLRDGTVVARSDGTVHHLFPVAIGGAEGEALRDWVTRESATRTIEIGLGYGISALFACQGVLRNSDPAASPVVVDPYPVALPRFLAEGRRFDLAFVDGNHRFDGIFVDLTYLGRLLRPGAIVLVDDDQLPAIARAASFFVTNLNWTLEEVSPVDELHQWAALRTSAVPDKRSFDEYVEF